MTFQERFQELLEPLLDMRDLGIGTDEAEHQNYYDTLDVVADLHENPNKLVENPQEFFQILQNLSSPSEGHCQYFAAENFSQLQYVIALAKNVSFEAWQLEPDAAQAYHLHVLNDTQVAGQICDTNGDPKSGYYFNDHVDPSKSVAFLDFRQNAEIISPEWGPDGEDIIQVRTVIFLLKSLNEIAGKALLISSSEVPERALAQVKYHLVLAGLCWSKPVQLPPSVTAAVKEIRCSAGNPEDLIQFSEPFSMLSEINACQGVLETFLSTYHVLENYMIRKVISGSLRAGSGSEFQRVRDFKRLGKETDQDEIVHLNGLFKACWNIGINGTSLSDTLTSTLTNLTSLDDFDAVLFDDFIRRLSIKHKSGSSLKLNDDFQNDDKSKKSFPRLVYSIRCAIVHNKATEFHLSNEELMENPAWQKIIGAYCLPVMLRIAFGIPSVAGTDNPIRYERRELSLF